MTALSETLSRFLGAIRDGTRTPADRQREMAKELIAKARALSRDLPRLANTAGPSVEALFNSKEAKPAIRRIRDGRITKRQFKLGLRKSELKSAEINAAWSLWSSPQWRRVLTTRGRLAALCLLAAVSLRAAVQREISESNVLLRMRESKARRKH
jgi:hypothetical protein